eukprot:11227617-Lingulodinium_polyedra.AAC.1
MHLADYWCTKLQYYFRVAEESGRGLPYRYTEAYHTEAPALGKEILALVDEQPLGHPSHAVVAELI